LRLALTARSEVRLDDPVLQPLIPGSSDIYQFKESRNYGVSLNHNTFFHFQIFEGSFWDKCTVPAISLISLHPDHVIPARNPLVRAFSQN
jgi:hypothetical protein